MRVSERKSSRRDWVANAVATAFFGLVVWLPALFRGLAGLLRRSPESEAARIADVLAIALLILGAFTFLQALIPVTTELQLMHSLHQLRVGGVVLTGTGYIACMLLSALVLYRSQKILSDAAAAARRNAARTAHDSPNAGCVL